MSGVVDTLRGVSNIITAVMHQHGIKDTDANVVVGLRDGFSAAALLAELEMEGSDAGGS